MCLWPAVLAHPVQRRRTVHGHIREPCKNNSTNRDEICQWTRGQQGTTYRPNRWGAFNVLKEYFAGVDNTQRYSQGSSSNVTSRCHSCSNLLYLLTSSAIHAVHVKTVEVSIRLKVCSRHLNWTELQQVDPVTRRVRCSRASASRLVWLAATRTASARLVLNTCWMRECHLCRVSGNHSVIAYGVRVRLVANYSVYLSVYSTADTSSAELMCCDKHKPIDSAV